MSGEPTAFPLICAPNIPPTNSKEKLGDHNLLSAAGIAIEATTTAEGVKIVVDATKLKIPETLFEGTKEDLVRITLECVRMTANLTKVAKYSLEMKASSEFLESAKAVKEAFETHDKKAPFVLHPAEQ